MSEHFLQVQPNEETPEDVIRQLGHVYAILIDYSSIPRSRRVFDLPGWIETFNELVEEQVGLQNFAPSVAVLCSGVDDEIIEQLDSVGAVVIERSQLPDGIGSFQALFEHLIPDIATRQHLHAETVGEIHDLELDPDTIKFLEGDGEGITEDDRQELLKILGRE